MRRKGVSMVMTIVAIGVITVLAVSISAFTLASYKNTVYKDKMDKLKLEAESGIDYGVYELKQFINSDPEVLSYEKFSDYNTQYGESDIDDQNTFYKSDGNIHSKIRIYNDEITDVPTGRDRSCIKIESNARYYSNGEPAGRPITVDEWIDKMSIKNDYFDRIFNKSSFTTAAKDEKNPGQFSINQDSTLNASGSMFLQDKVELNPGKASNSNDPNDPNDPNKQGIFTDDELEEKGDEADENERKISVKSRDNGINTGFPGTNLPKPTRLGDIREGIHYYKDIYNCDSEYDSETRYPGWENKLMDTLPLCNITTKDKDQLEGGEYGSVPTDGSKIINIPGTNIYSYAAKDNGTKPIDFEMLVDGQKPPLDVSENDTKSDTHGIYGRIRSLNSEKQERFLPEYGKYYKLILIDGNLDINDDHEEDFNNYLIFCTGTVTFKGESHFFNCSIFANQIKFEKDEVKNKNADVEFYGVSTAASKSHINDIDVKSDVGTDLSPLNKGCIYSYLIKNLDKFGDYLRFNVLKFSES